VTRPGKWGNPFGKGEWIADSDPLFGYAASVLPPGSAQGFKSVRLLRPEDLVAAHFRWFMEQPGLMMSVGAELGGHDLACWCQPGTACHGDFLLGMANDLPGDGNAGL